MRRRISKLASGAALAALLAAGAAVGVASAQDVRPPTTADRFDDRDRGMDWGWIGLLGLGGLAGLMGRERHGAYRGTQPQAHAPRA